MLAGPNPVRWHVLANRFRKGSLVSATSWRLFHPMNFNKKVISKWDSERELFKDDIVHLLQNTISGVTRVGVTRGGNSWVPPFLLKNLTTFLVIASECGDLFSCRLLTTPIFPRRLSSVLSKFSHKKLISGRVSPLWRVSPGAVPQVLSP